MTGGTHDGHVFSYVGSSALTPQIDLKRQDYRNPDLWKQVGLTSVNAAAEVQAYSEGSSINATGALGYTAMATETINAFVLAHRPRSPAASSASA